MINGHGFRKVYLLIVFAAIALLALLAFLSYDMPTNERETRITREEANRLIRYFAKGYGASIAGLNEANLAGIDGPFGTLYFEFDAESNRLTSRALIHKFRSPVRSTVWEALKALETPVNDTGGGKLDYLADSNSVFLMRFYENTVPKKQFVEDMERLAAASQVWFKDVLPKAFDAAEAAEKKQ